MGRLRPMSGSEANITTVPYVYKSPYLGKSTDAARASDDLVAQGRGPAPPRMIATQSDWEITDPLLRKIVNNL
jgi:hypothetical protein